MTKKSSNIFDYSLMGQHVIVKQKYERSFEKGGHFWRAVNVENLEGHISGFSVIRDMPRMPNGAECIVNVPCILVTCNPRRKPVRIPLNGFVKK